MLSTPPGPGSAGPGSAGPGFAGPGLVPGRARGRRAAWLAVTAAAGGLLAGCASATTPQAGSTPAAGKATQPARGQGGTVPASPAATGASGLGGLALCQPSSLHVTVNTSQTGVAIRVVRMGMARDRRARG